MAKYLLLWELNPNLVPADPKERAAGWQMFMEMLKQDASKGPLKDWGTYIGENKGFCIVEGSALDVMKVTQQYAPHVVFEAHAYASIDESSELLQHLAGQ